MQEIELSPHAASLSQAMRDLGYSLETAVADLIDNSITARAKNVRIFFEAANSDDSCLAIIDDGSGMTKDELLEAMRPGSRDPREKRDANDLGRFGLGLKTASFSQCRLLTVVSRRNGELFAVQWDLDLITLQNKWVATILSAEEIDGLPFFDKMGSQGTYVLWRKLDRLLEGGVSERSKINVYDKLSVVEKHLALVFHRYLSGDYEKRKVAIWINGHPVAAFDPFCVSNKATQLLPEEIVRIDGHEVRIQPYILPHHSRLLKEEYDFFYRSQGDFVSNQGAYVYRNGRLMAWGDWFRLAPKSEATKLARVRIDFPNALDERWTIDIKKSRAHPPSEVREKLRLIINRIADQSKRVHVGRGNHLFEEQELPLWLRYPDRKGTMYGINREHPLLAALADKVEPQIVRVFDHILDVIEGAIPIEAIYADYSNTPRVFQDHPEISPDMLLQAITAIAELFRTEGELDKVRLSGAILTVPPYSQYREITLKIIEDMV